MRLVLALTAVLWLTATLSRVSEAKELDVATLEERLASAEGAMLANLEKRMAPKHEIKENDWGEQTLRLTCTS